jgi:hypothetical protein
VSHSEERGEVEERLSLAGLRTERNGGREISDF